MTLQVGLELNNLLPKPPNSLSIHRNHFHHFGDNKDSICECCPKLSKKLNYFNYISNRDYHLNKNSKKFGKYFQLSCNIFL